MPRIIAIDGHDGSGKTSLASLLAQHLETVVAKPYVGQVSEDFYRFLPENKFSALNASTLGAVQGLIGEHENKDWLVFDRHWATVFSLVPKHYWESWQPLPTTIITWASPEKTLERLNLRKEAKKGQVDRNTLAYHQKYCSIFAALAQGNEVPLLDTTDLKPEDAFQRMLLMLNLERF